MATSGRMPYTSDFNPPTRYQFKVMLALSLPGARLRHHSSITPKTIELAGRAQIVDRNGLPLGLLTPLPSYTARSLMKQGYIERVDSTAEHAYKTFDHIDYMLTEHGRMVISAYKK